MSSDNPFGPKTESNPALTLPDDIYESVDDRTFNVINDKEYGEDIKDAIKFLRGKLEPGEQIGQDDFARLELVEVGLIDLNDNIQRGAEVLHIANIIRNFSSMISQVINVTFIKSTGRYSAWDSQQTAISFKILQIEGIISPDVKLRCMVADDDQKIPGSDLVGEAAGNYNFRKINTERKKVGEFVLHRSRVNGFRIYGSTEEEEVRAHRMQEVVDDCNMQTSMKTFTTASKGDVTHIKKMEELACFDGTSAAFNEGLKILRKVLSMHDKYFSNCKGVHVDFQHAIGDMFIAAEKNGVIITDSTIDNIYQLFRGRYKTPHGFSKDCKKRHKDFVQANNLAGAGARGCYAAILYIDYAKQFNKSDLPNVAGVKLYAGI